MRCLFPSARRTAPLLFLFALAAPAAHAIDECNIEWFRVSPATSPGEKIRWATAYDARRGVAVVFGGGNPLTGGSARGTDTTWEFANGTWTLRHPANRPSLRNAAAMAFDSDRGVCVLFGGGDNVFQNEIPQNDIWEYDGNNWTLRQATNYAATDQPPPFDDPKMVYDSARRKCVLIAASDRLGGNVNYNTKTWLWDGAQWSAVNAAPPARYNAAVAYDAARQMTLLHGGLDAVSSAGPFSDTWAWNGAAWTQIATTGATARQEHAMAYDERRQVITLTAGRVLASTQGEMLNDTWEWNGSAWTLRADAQSFGYAPRRLHQMWFDRAEQRLISFGGTWSQALPQGGFVHTITDEIFEARPPGRWIDFNFNGSPQNGFFYTPFRTLSEGAATIQPGCTLNLKPGTSSEALTITRAMRLEAYSTPVTIGAP